MPVAIVAAYVASQAIKANGARKAANAQNKGIDAAKEDLNAGYDKALGYQAPYVDAGKQTIGQLAEGLKAGGDFNRQFTAADFQADPGYQFRQDQGQKAVERSAAAKGGALSGAAIKGASEYGQNLASQEYQSAYQRYNNDLSSRFSRLSSVAQMGQHAADYSSNLDSERGTNLGNLSINKGNVNAAKETAYAAAGANAVKSIGNAIGGGMNGGMSSGGSGGGSSISDYAGNTNYSDWVNKQYANGGGSTSYGKP